MRKPFQGLTNVIRFNWHFYLFALGILLCLLSLSLFFTKYYSILFITFAILPIISVSITLLTTFYVYDLSNLYKLTWLNNLKSDNQNIVNINAGFDETSELLLNHLRPKNLTVLDFYDETKHTEISIKRARNAFPPYPKTISVKTDSIPLETASADKVFCFLSAHEIRNDAERIIFFAELNRILHQEGEIIVTEHLRDIPNFLAYNIGFFHFHSKQTWLETFTQANLKVKQEIKITPFISTFILEKNGNSR